jgi:serine/threonine protein kinase
MLLLGKYEVLEQIGSGSMGVLLHARDTILGREVALKQMRRGPNVDPQIRERFLREARVCASLQHPSIVTVFDLAESEDAAYIVMELLIGEDWSGAIQHCASISLDRRLGYMTQICDALDYAHRRGIVHRDIKPSNLFLTEDGRPKILDFGIARLPESKMTIQGRMPGTPDYMAPEQLLGQTCTALSDVFSAALVFCEFLTGAHPFRGPFIPRRIVNSPPDSLCGVDPQISSPLETALFRALEKDPQHRFQSAAELGEALRSIRQELSTDSPRRRHAASQYASPATAAPAKPATEGVLRPPAGADPDEWRLSEFMRLLDEFDKAIQESSAPKLKAALSSMEKLGSVDPRFGVAIEDCQRRYQDLAARAPAAAAPPAPPIPPAKPAAVTPESYAKPRQTSVPTEPLPPRFAAPPPPAPPVSPPPQYPPRLSSATGFAGKPAAAPPPTWSWPLEEPAVPPVSPPSPMLAPAPPPPPTILPGSSGPFTMGPVAFEERPKPAYLAPPPTPQPSPPDTATAARQRKIILYASITAVALIGLLLGVKLLFFSQAERVASVASASTAADVVSVLAAPANGEKEIVTLRRGERLNVLRLPQTRYQQWIAVQAVTPVSVMTPGYARRTDLTNWQSENADTEFRLLTLFAPVENASRDDIRTFVDRLRALVARHPGTPQGAQAEALARQWDATAAGRR